MAVLVPACPAVANDGRAPLLPSVPKIWPSAGAHWRAPAACTLLHAEAPHQLVNMTFTRKISASKYNPVGSELLLLLAPMRAMPDRFDHTADAYWPAPTSV